MRMSARGRGSGTGRGKGANDPITLEELMQTQNEMMHVGILNVNTKSRLRFLILITAPKMLNQSLMSLKPSCHPQHDMRDAVLKYAIALLNK